MKTRLSLLLLLCALSVQGCAHKALPAWQGQPLAVHFSARVLPQAADLPLQGGLRVSAEQGTLAVILQHGRTLGQCHLARPAGQDGMRLTCRAAEGMERAQPLLARVALAAFRSVPLLRAQNGMEAQPGMYTGTHPGTDTGTGTGPNRGTDASAKARSTPRAGGEDWRVSLTPHKAANTDSGTRAPDETTLLYEDSQGSVCFQNLTIVP